MGILFVGEADIVGEYVAKRLYKEGRKVYWLTESKTQNLWPKEIKGRVYRQILDVSKYAEIFKINKIERIIFLAPVHREYVDKETEMSFQPLTPLLLEILRLSLKFQVKQFILISSVQLNNEGNLSPVISDLRAAEVLCECWKENYNLPFLNLRIGHVYGSGHCNHMTYLNQVIEKMHTDTLGRVANSESEVLDFLHGDDLSDAIFRAITNELRGCYNLCSEQSIRTSELFKELAEETHYIKGIEYMPRDYRSIYNRGQFDSSDFKKESGWICIHSFLEEKKEVIRAINSIRLDNSNKKVKEKKFRDHLAPLRPFVENITLFLIISVLLNFTRNSSDFRFVDVRLVYVVIISIIYGFRQGIFAILLASLSYLFSVVNMGIDTSYLLYSIDSWLPFAMYLVAGASVGYLFDKKQIKIELLEEEKENLQQKHTFLKGIYNEVCEVKEQLQRQIIVSKDSFGRIYEITKELDSFKPELIFFKAINVLEDVMESHSVCIYTINVDNLSYLRLIAHSKEMSGKLGGTLFIDNLPLLKEAIEKKEVFVNKGLLEGYPAYAAPLIKDGKVVSLVLIYDVAFEMYTIYYYNLFQITVGLIQGNLLKAYSYSQITSSERFIENTMIYKPKAFREQLKIIEEAKVYMGISYILTNLLISGDEDKNLDMISSKLSPILRAMDFVGQNEEGGYYIVFMQTDRSHLENIERRFMDKGLTLEAREDIV